MKKNLRKLCDVLQKLNTERLYQAMDRFGHLFIGVL